MHCLKIAEDRSTAIFSLVLRCVDDKTGTYKRIGTLLQRPNDFSARETPIIFDGTEEEITAVIL